MMWWEYVTWIVWILWGVLTGFGLWIMVKLDQDDEFEDDSHHWRQDRELVLGGQIIIYGWVIFSIIWIGINIYWRF